MRKWIRKILWSQGHKKNSGHCYTLFYIVLCRPCERFSPITLCRTVCPTLTAIIAVRDTPRGGGCFRVDCFPACIRRRGVLLDLWGTQLSNRTAILNIPINPWGRRRGWLLETHRLNKTPWWDRTRINKPPCTPVEGGRGGEECLILFLSIYMSHLTSHCFNSDWFAIFCLSAQLCSLLNDWVVKCEQECRLTSLHLHIFSYSMHF